MQVVQASFSPISTSVEVLRCLWTAVSVLRRSDKAIFTVVEVLCKLCRCFGTRNMLRFTFNKGRGCTVLVDSRFIAW